MEQFIYDMIHMTEGEKLIEYWWLWLLYGVIVFLAFGFAYGAIKIRKAK